MEYGHPRMWQGMSAGQQAISRGGCGHTGVGARTCTFTAWGCERITAWGCWSMRAKRESNWRSAGGPEAHALKVCCASTAAGGAGDTCQAMGDGRRMGSKGLTPSKCAPVAVHAQPTLASIATRQCFSSAARTRFRLLLRGGEAQIGQRASGGERGRHAERRRLAMTSAARNRSPAG